MPKLSDFDQSQVKVVGEPAQPKALKLSDIDPKQVTVVAEPMEVPKDQTFGEKAAQFALDSIIAVGRGWDAITGAPSRSALRAIQKGDNPFSAFTGQFGRAPEKAPTGAEIAEFGGLSTEEFPVPLSRGITGERLKTSPAKLGGVAIDVAADWTNVVPVSTLVKGAAWSAKKGAQVAGKVASKTGKLVLGESTQSTLRNKAIESLSNVHHENVGKYAKMSEKEIASVPSSVEIKDRIDGAVSKVGEIRQQAKAHYAEAEKNFDELYRQKIKDLRNQAVPISQADAVMASLEEEKRVLGSLSAQADDALSRMQGTIKKDDLVRFINKVAKSSGVGKTGAQIGEAAANARSRIFALRDRIVNELPDQITFPHLRDIMRQIRNDTDFNMAAGEFNDTLNSMRKEITHGMSEVLKGRGQGMAADPAAKEYEAIMGRMAPLSESLYQLNKYYGTRERALASLQSLADGRGKGKALVARDILENHAKLTGKKDILESVDKMIEARELAIKASSDPGAILPNELIRLQQYKLAVQELEQIVDPLKRLGPNSTQSVIKNLQGGAKSLENIKSLRVLEEMTGEQFIDWIEKRGVIDSFGRDATRGSKFTKAFSAAGAAAGSVIAGPTGAAVGGGIGAGVGLVADKNAGAMARKLLDIGKQPILVTPSPGSMPMNLKDFSKSVIKDRSRIDNILKGSQVLHSQSDEHQKKREAVRRRIKAGETP